MAVLIDGPDEWAEVLDLALHWKKEGKKSIKISISAHYSRMGSDHNTADANDQDSENNDDDGVGKTDESSSDLERPERPQIKKAGRRSTTDKLRDEAAAQAEVDTRMGTHVSELMKLWKCDDKSCKNYEYTCHKVREEGGIQTHYKLLSTHLSQWNEAIKNKEASLTDPPIGLNLMSIGKQTPKRTPHIMAEEALREQRIETREVMQGLLKAIIPATAPAATTIAVTTPAVVTPSPLPLPYNGYPPQNLPFAGYPPPFAPQYQQFAPQFGTNYPYQHNGYGYGSPMGMSAFSGQQPQQFLTQYSLPHHSPAQYPPSPAPVAPAGVATLPVRLSPPRASTKHSRRPISSSSEYSDDPNIPPSSPLRASDGFARILHHQDFSKLLRDYINWQIYKAPSEKTRFDSVYEKIHNEGYGLEDIQGFKNRNWTRIKVPLGIGRRLRGGIKMFLNEQIAWQQQQGQGAAALMQLAGHIEQIRHDQSYMEDAEAAKSQQILEEQEYE